MFETQAAALRKIYQTHADARYGLETISQLEHALQAAQLAEERNEPPAFVLAALLHDIGHLTANMGDDPAAAGIDNRHEILGADWLAARLPATVSEPVRLHVEAKRYLCAVDPSYHGSLSPASHQSLQLQGGIMTAAEVQDFLQLESAGAAIRLRRYDDAAKEPARAVPGFESYRPLLVSLIQVPTSGLTP